MTYQKAIDSIPEDTALSGCFGNPGEGGYYEYYHCQNGTLYEISNGDWYAISPFFWTVKQWGGQNR